MGLGDSTSRGIGQVLAFPPAAVLALACYANWALVSSSCFSPGWVWATLHPRVLVKSWPCPRSNVGSGFLCTPELNLLIMIFHLVSGLSDGLVYGVLTILRPLPLTGGFNQLLHHWMGLSACQSWGLGHILALAPRCSLGSGSFYSTGVSLLIMLLPWMGVRNSSSCGKVEVLALAHESLL